jgi:quinol-cytochrome oxidoreductase complex cytochrome b subunit
MELLRRLPLGEQVRTLLVPDRIGGPLSLLRFYALHIAVIPTLMLSLISIHFFRIRRSKGVLPYL